MCRQKFHISGETGWINDPNGLVFYKGKYHAFFQYYPHAAHWGPMHWGHAVSDDLIKWQYLPVALAPGGNGDKDGCFSGTAIVVGERLFLMYTGFNDYGGGVIRQVQCVAYSDDGVNFVKSTLNPVIDEKILPEDYDISDFRDPGVWRHGDDFYALIAARKTGENSRLLLFTSRDMLNWKFVSDSFEESRGAMFECPDFDENAGVLFYSEQFAPPAGNVNPNIHASSYRAAKLDYDTGRFVLGGGGTVDYGFDFYAPQSFSGTDENIYIAWQQMWDRNIPSAPFGWAGCMTLPRRFYIDGDKLVTEPVSLEKYYGEAAGCERENFDGEFKLDGDIYVLEIETENAKELKIEIKKSENYTTLIKIENGALVFDRSRSGETINGRETDNLSVQGIRTMPLDDPENLKIKIVCDRFSAEIFAEGKAMSSTVYNFEGDQFINISGKAARLKVKRYLLNL